MSAQRLIKWSQFFLVAGFLLGGCFHFVAPVLAAKCVTGKDCSIPVKFTGIYLENTCEIRIDGKLGSSTVNLPKISTTRLQTDGSEAGSTGFNIELKFCPGARNVDLYFVSAGVASDPSTGNLVNNTGPGMSNGVQVRLHNALKSQLRIDDESNFQRYIIPSDGSAVTQYYTASYYAKGAGSVTPGLVNTLAGIELRYR